MHIEADAFERLQATETLAESVERKQRRWSRPVHHRCPLTCSLD
jgi:hypothetical protein